MCEWICSEKHQEYETSQKYVLHMQIKLHNYLVFIILCSQHAYVTWIWAKEEYAIP